MGPSPGRGREVGGGGRGAGQGTGVVAAGVPLQPQVRPRRHPWVVATRPLAPHPSVWFQAVGTVIKVRRLIKVKTPRFPLARGGVSNAVVGGATHRLK